MLLNQSTRWPVPEHFWNQPAQRPHQWPALSLHTNDDGVRIEVDLPGVDGDSIDLSFEDGVLWLRGERPGPDVDNRPVHNERRFGKFERAVRLGETLDPGTIDAEFTDGVLTIEIAQKQEMKPRKVEIRFQSGQQLDTNTADSDQV